MKILFYIPIFVAYNLVAQQPKKLTEKFFPDFDIEIPTPAFQKKKATYFIGIYSFNNKCFF